MPAPAMAVLLETERLVLRRSRVDDAVVYRELWTERDPRVPPHRRIGADGRPDLRDVAERLRADLDDPGHGLLTVRRRHEGDVIGYCGLLLDGRSVTGEPELAYELLRRTHGAGYATEAAGAVVAWADASGHRRLWAGVRSWNAASQNVLRKLGFVLSGRVDADEEHGDSEVWVRSAPGSGRPPPAS